MAYTKTIWENVLVYDSLSSFPSPGTNGVYYFAKDTGTMYVWNGSSYSVSEDNPPSLNKDNLNKMEQGIYEAHQNKVDKDGNKMLSSNDYTDTDKRKLAGVEAGAEPDRDFVTRRYDGVNLATKFADEIEEHGGIGHWVKWRCQNNNLNDLFPHDYFEITFKNGKKLKAEIAGIDTYFHNGDTELTKHHIDFITKDCWETAVQYNPVNYNNGVGLDKFIGDGATKVFQLTHRADGNFPALSKVLIGTTETTDYTYDVETGELTMGTAPAANTAVKAIWANPINVPYLASKLYAYINSVKMGVPNEAAADPLLTEVDYTQDGIWYNMPDELKEVIANKRYYTSYRYTQNSLRTGDSSGGWVDLGKLWIPDEIEVYGYPVWDNYQYAIMFGRQYPCFKNGNRTKGSGNGGGRTGWWLAVSGAGGSTYSCGVNNNGNATNHNASYSNRVPVCFRITG